MARNFLLRLRHEAECFQGRATVEKEDKKSELELEFKMIFVNCFQSLVINEVDEGTECEICLTDCPGFKAHEWR